MNKIDDLLVELDLVPDEVVQQRAASTPEGIQLAVNAQRLEPSREPVEVQPLQGQPERVKLQREEPRHVVVAYMYAAGRSRTEIAQATGYSEAQVTNIKQQPHTKLRIAQILQQQGGDQVASMFEAELATTVDCLVTMRDDPDAPKAVRLAAIKEILDRGRGKAVAHIKTETVDPVSDVKAEYERLQELVRQGQAQLEQNVRTAGDASVRINN